MPVQRGLRESTIGRHPFALERANVVHRSILHLDQMILSVLHNVGLHLCGPGVHVDAQ